MIEQKTLEDYHGSAPNFTGGVDAATYVRRIRSGLTLGTMEAIRDNAVRARDEMPSDAAELARLRAEVAALRAALAHYTRDAWQPVDDPDEECSYLLLQHDPTVARQALGLNVDSAIADGRERCA